MLYAESIWICHLYHECGWQMAKPILNFAFHILNISFPCYWLVISLFVSYLLARQSHVRILDGSLRICHLLSVSWRWIFNPHFSFLTVLFYWISILISLVSQLCFLGYSNLISLILQSCFLGYSTFNPHFSYLTIVFSLDIQSLFFLLHNSVFLDIQPSFRLSQNSVFLDIQSSFLLSHNSVFLQFCFLRYSSLISLISQFCFLGYSTRIYFVSQFCFLDIQASFLLCHNSVFLDIQPSISLGLQFCFLG